MSTPKVSSDAQSTALQEIARSAVGPHLFIQVAFDNSNSLWLCLYQDASSDENSVALIKRSGPYKSIAELTSVLYRHATSFAPPARLPESHYSEHLPHWTRSVN